MSNGPGRTHWAEAARKLGIATLAQLGFPRLQRQAELRAAWGNAGKNDAWLASRYFDLTRALSAISPVDDRTWADLEFPRFFATLDTTITAAGRQHLFRQLRTYELDPLRMAERYRLCDRLRTDAQLREKVQLVLTPLDRISTANIADVLLGAPLEAPRYDVFIAPWVLMTVLAIIGVALHVVPLWAGVVLLVFNALFAWLTYSRLNPAAEAMTSCRRLLSAATKLASLRDATGVPSLTKLADKTATFEMLASKMRGLELLAALDRLRNMDFVGGLVAIVSACFLLRLAIYSRAIHRFMLQRPLWLSVFDLVGEADAAVAIANFMHRHPRHCRPVVSSESIIRIDNGYHPLLQAPVTNSLSLLGRSALVTGSNMAGKTTLIKTVAINIVLGHTLGICLADQATIPDSGVMALIRGEQSVESGKSRYFAEVEAIRHFIEQAASGKTRIFVLDEPFSGTNTIERLGAARAVLDAIASQAQVLVTTHDVELQELLDSRFELLHFQEDPAVDGFFDYKLRIGPSTQRNAIKVLERLGYPQEIIVKALATIKSLEL